MTSRRIDEIDPGCTAGFGADYWDSFGVPAVPGGHPAREWARLSLRGAERFGGAFSRVAWQGLLGFRLAGAGSDGTLVGWQIQLDSPERFVLAADGRLMAGRMHFAVTGAEVVWTTMLHFHRPVARLIWAGAGSAHRVVAPSSLADARHCLLAGITG